MVVLTAPPKALPERMGGDAVLGTPPCQGRDQGLSISEIEAAATPARRVNDDDVVITSPAGQPNGHLGAASRIQVRTPALHGPRVRSSPGWSETVSKMEQSSWR
jgi:hypothetical protein